VHNASPLLDHIVENFFEGRQVVIEFDCGKLANQHWVLVFLWSFISYDCLEVCQLALLDVILVDLKSFACLLKSGRVKFKATTFDLAQLSEWIEEVINARFLTDWRIIPSELIT